jgi:hypothetical protein
MHIRNMILQGLFLTLSIVAVPADAQVVVIVSAKSAVAALDAAQINDIFLGKRAQFPTGVEAVPLDQPEEAPARQRFYSKVTGRTPAQLKVHWSRLLFTGRGQPPREMANADAVRKAVADNPHFISYIDKSALDPSVKVVFETD